MADSDPPPLTEPPEDPQMHIHKLKPVHSWRDFLRELGTIVLGIIIAISLEHLVESWHWDSEVKIARQAIAAEITANNVNLFAFRVATAPCVDRKFSEADAILTALEARRKPGNITIFRPPSGSLTRNSEWESERASQVLTHFPRAELALMSRYYAQLPNFRDWVAAEGTAWQELIILQKPPAGITTSDLIRLRVNLTMARRMDNLVTVNAKRQLRLSKQLGIADPAPDPVRVKNYCTMSTEDYRRYRDSQDLR